MGIISPRPVPNKLVEVTTANSVVTPWAGPEVGDRSVAHGSPNGLGVAPGYGSGLIGAQLVVEVSLGRSNEPVEQRDPSRSCLVGAVVLQGVVLSEGFGNERD